MLDVNNEAVMQNSKNYNFMKKAIPIVKNMTMDLQHIGVTFVSYLKISKDNNFLYICNSKKWLSYIYAKQDNNIDDFVLPNTFLEEKVHKNNYYNNTKFSLSLITGIPEHTNEFHSKLIENNIWHVLGLLRQKKNCIELISFGAHPNNNNIINVYLNNLDFFERYGILFKSKLNKHFDSMKKNQIINEINSAFTKNNQTKNINLNELKFKIDSELYTTPHTIELLDGVRCTITGRELECLSQLQKGFCTKTISKFLKISKRTVEKHLENLKNKFNCSHKQGLINIYRYNFNNA